MRFIVGLGNPGPKYVDTRHNFGFLCLEELSRLYRKQPDALGDDRIGLPVSSGWSLVEQSSRPGLAQWERWVGPDGVEVSLLWPLTYMNVSGKAVEFLASHLGSMPSQDRILLVVDDMSLPLGQLRLRKRGSSGGHNGLKSVEALFGNGDYPRLRLGLGQPPDGVEVVDFVLSPFHRGEVDAARAVVGFAAEAARDWALGVSFEGLVGKVNGWRWQGQDLAGHSEEVNR